MRSLLILALLPAWTTTAEPWQEGYSFTVDGTARELWVMSLSGTSSTPSPGDVIHVRDIPLVLEGPGAYRYRTTPKDDGRLFQIGPDGKEKVVGVQVSWTFEGDSKVVYNPFAKLSEDEVRGLRGARLDGWPEGIEKALALLTPGRVALTVTDQTGSKLPKLPAGLGYLLVDERSSSGIRDYRTLLAHKDLRLFSARTLSEEPFDASVLKANTGLRYLGLTMTKPVHLEVLAGMSDLREVRLDWNEEIKDVEWARGLKALVVLDLDKTGVEDLSPLEGLGALVDLSVERTPLRKLPSGAFPLLKSLRVMSTRLSDPEVAAFRRANPGCKVAHRWVQGLKEALVGATRVRVRSGGTCHVDVKKEKTLLDTAEAKDIRDLVGSFEVDESRSGFHCMCCGEPSFEFYRGETLVATIGFHHGSGMRWPGGWPGDAAITGECADFLVEWLAQRNIPGPKAAREEGKRSQAAMAKRWERCRAIMPAETYQQLVDSKSEADRMKAMESSVSDAVGRVRLYLRLFGCDDGSWNLYAGLDPLLQSLLSKVKSEDLSEAVSGLLGDREGAMGAARWILNEKNWKSLTPEALKKSLPALVRLGLSHPRLISRQRTLHAVLAIGGSDAIEPLREALDPKWSPRKLEAAEEAEPNGMVSYSGGDADVDDEASTVAFAAYALARLGDAPSAAAVRALRDKAMGKDRELLEKAVRRFDAEKK